MGKYAEYAKRKDQEGSKYPGWSEKYMIHYNKKDPLRVGKVDKNGKERTSQQNGT
ncbi:MAG: hypothetical protein IJ740_13570 [Ruminococcus sp.]|nr:hypothetical protein [Ruminococcus sp.]